MTLSQVNLIEPFMFYYNSLRLLIFDTACALNFFLAQYFRYLTFPQRVKHTKFVN